MYSHAAVDCSWAQSEKGPGRGLCESLREVATETAPGAGECLLCDLGEGHDLEGWCQLVVARRVMFGGHFAIGAVKGVRVFAVAVT